MSDAYLLLTPILMLGVLALTRFVGCDLIFTLQDPGPPAPENLVATNGNDRVDLSWEPSEGAATYVVHRGEASGGPYATSFEGITTTFFSDTAVNPGQTFFYTVTAANSAGREGPPSNEASATPAFGLVIAKTLGTIRNNFNGPVGMVIQIGATPLSVVGLGRIFVAGNSGMHRLRVADSVNGNTIPGAEVVVDLATAPAAVPSEFVYAIFPSPVLLSANTEFYVLSDEIDGGDQWFDLDTTVVTTPVAAVTNAVFQQGAGFVRSGGPGHTFGPVDVLHA